AVGVDLQNVGVRFGRVGPDREADRLAHFVLARAALPGTCQVALRSVGVADGQVGRQIAEGSRLRIERALLVFPARDDLLFEHRHGVLPRQCSRYCVMSTTRVPTKKIVQPTGYTQASVALPLMTDA